MLEPGATLLHYRLVEKLGEGGMGVVWRATDTSLDREVAIKVLPQAFSNDADRLARFEREAKLLATLNHPNVGAIHSFHRANGVHFLALELIEGEDLASATARGPLPLEDALETSIGIARALEAAHERGVIHRDLKPANVKRGVDGTVKVLDFGLAKAVETTGGSDGASPTWAPTVTSAGTRAGMILGTAAYMSPEQARGKPLDARTDLWSFGCVLYECLTGEVLFHGETVSDSLAAILRKEPDWTALPAATPVEVRTLLRRCLTRDPSRRQQSAADARVVLQDALDGGIAGGETAAAAPPARRVGAWAAMFAVAGLLAGWGFAAWLSGAGSETNRPVTHVAIPLPDGLRLKDAPRLTPDGRIVVFTAVDVTPNADHERKLYVRHLKDEALQPVPVDDVEEFALSPDGTEIAYVGRETGGSQESRLYRVPLDLSTPPQAISSWSSRWWGLVWPRPDRLTTVDHVGRERLVVLPVGGGEPEFVELTATTTPYGTRVQDALPGDRFLLGHAVSFASGQYVQYVAAIDSQTGAVETLISDGSNPLYLDSGHLVFGRGAQILAVPFDVERRAVTGAERAILAGVWAEGAYTGGRYGASAGGDLAYYGGGVQGSQRTLEILTRDGEATLWSEERLQFNSVNVSPDGRRLATQIDNTDQGDALLQIRVSDFARPRLVMAGLHRGMDCTHPSWSTDSRRLAYVCADQTESLVLLNDAPGREPSREVLRTDFEDGLDLIGFAIGDRTLIGFNDRGNGGPAFLALDTESDSGSAIRTVATEDGEVERARISKDGRWLLYFADVGGRREPFVRSVSADGSLGPRIALGLDIGQWAFWSSKPLDRGYEIVFGHGGFGSDSGIYTARLTLEPEPDLSDVVDLGIDTFESNIYDSSSLPDGRLVIVRTPTSEYGASELRLVLNWQSEVARLVR